jgi:hypothetical protein
MMNGILKSTRNQTASSRSARRGRSQNQSYRRAFEWLDNALSENTRSNNIEKINRLRLELFGCAPE